MRQQLEFFSVSLFSWFVNKFGVERGLISRNVSVYQIDSYLTELKLAPASPRYGGVLYRKILSLGVTMRKDSAEDKCSSMHCI